MTQIGADGRRYPTGQAPPTFTPRTTGNRLAALEGASDIPVSQSQTRMLAGDGFADDGSSIGGAGFVVPQSWETMDVTVLWGMWAGTPGDTSFTLLGDFMEIGGPLANPAPLGSVTVPAEDITVGDLLAATVATDVECAGRMFSATYGRTATIMGGSYDTELQAYADADTASYTAGQGGVFAVVFTPTNITGS